MTAPGGARPGVGVVARAALLRALLLGLCWWAVSEGDPSMRGYGVVLVAAVTAVTFALAPARRRSLRLAHRAVPTLSLAGWFLWRSVLGGADVALRAVRRPVRTDPVVLEHRLSLPPGAPRVVCATLSSLMPGALSVHLADDVLVLHVIDRALPAREQVDALQRRIAAVLSA